MLMYINVNANALQLLCDLCIMFDNFKEMFTCTWC